MKIVKRCCSVLIVCIFYCMMFLIVLIFFFTRRVEFVAKSRSSWVRNVIMMCLID